MSWVRFLTLPLGWVEDPGETWSFSKIPFPSVVQMFKSLFQLGLHEVEMKLRKDSVSP